MKTSWLVSVASFILMGGTAFAQSTYSNTTPSPQISAPVPGRPLQLAVTETTPDRDTYAHEAGAKMVEWQKKLHDYAKTVEAKGEQAGTTAQNDLDIAWIKADAAARKLKIASADTWENAKVSYEIASRRLADVWQKTNPDSK